MTMFSGRDVVEKPKAIVPMPEWPGASAAIRLAQWAARDNPPMALGMKLADGSEIILEYQANRMPGHKLDEMYDTLPPPLLSVLVLDHRVGVKRILGLGKRVREHQAERLLQEIHKHLGKDTPIGTMAASIDETDSRRRYWFKCQ